MPPVRHSCRRQRLDVVVNKTMRDVVKKEKEDDKHETKKKREADEPQLVSDIRQYLTPVLHQFRETNTSHHIVRNIVMSSYINSPNQFHLVFVPEFSNDGLALSMNLKGRVVKEQRNESGTRMIDEADGLK